MTGDLISREDTLSALKGVIARTGLYGVSMEVILANVPAVEAEPVVHAHWICDCEPYHICSNCRHKFSLFDRVPRCPNCGAHMDEEVSRE